MKLSVPKRVRFHRLSRFCREDSETLCWTTQLFMMLIMRKTLISISLFSIHQIREKPMYWGQSPNFKKIIRIRAESAHLIGLIVTQKILQRGSLGCQEWEIPKLQALLKIKGMKEGTLWHKLLLLIQSNKCR